MATRRLLYFGFLLALPLTVQAQSGYRIGAPGAWVVPVKPDLSRQQPKGGLGAGYDLLVVDFQEKITRSGVERFHHVAYRPLTDGAVQEQSQVTIDFSPAYEAITLNGVTVTRNGHPVNQLAAARIRVSERETNLESHILEDAKTITVVLEDVKPGDIIEYSYTRTGSNPVFAGHYMLAFATQAEVPIQQFQYRVLAPRDRALFHRASEPTVEPTISDRGEFREYLWAAQAVPARLTDRGVPDWYDAFPTVRVTDYASWRAVAMWADSLFAVPTQLPPRLAARVEAIRTGVGQPENRVLAALRYVQDSVRYVGIEIGANSHRPFPPATVLARGYGDCKDKVLLLVTMLRALGFDARPALVSTTFLDHMEKLLPSGTRFDHAIVRVEMEGTAYWVDPTALYQRGGLSEIAPPFRAALVVGPGTDSLTAIPASLMKQPHTDIQVRLDLAAVNQPAMMRVETRYEGLDADRMRARLRTVSVPELAKENADYYAKAYPGITVTAPPTTEDNEGTNVLRTVEQYSIPTFWQQSKNRLGYYGILEPLELEDALPAVTSATRSMPLRISHPRRYTYTITARLNARWNIRAEKDSVITAGIRFVRSRSTLDSAFVLSFEYQTLSDFVPASLAAAHLEKLAGINNEIAFQITPPSQPASDGSSGGNLNLTVVLLGGITVLLAAFAAVKLAKRSPPKWYKNTAEPNETLNGLEGWLLLVGLGLLVRPGMLLYTIVTAAPSYSATAWASHTVPGGVSYHAYWAPVLLFELIANLTLLVFGVWGLVEFFRRRRWFPPLFIVLVVAAAAVDVTDALLAHQIPAIDTHDIDWSPRLRALLVALIWSQYMVKSVRVKSTFVKE